VRARKLLGLATLVTLASCQERADTKAVAESCGSGCPVGTWRDEQRTNRSEDTPYADFVEGSCAWSCVAVTDCPVDTVPVITESCFTCAMALPDGTLGGGSCDEDTWVSGRDDAPDGEEATEDVGGSPIDDDNDNDGLRFRAPEVVGVVSLSFPPRAIATDGGLIWAADWETERLVAVDVASGAEVDALSLPGRRPRELAVQGDAVWVMDEVLERWDLASGTLQQEEPAAVGTGLASDDGLVIEVDGTTVRLWTPESGAVVDHGALQVAASGPVAASDGRLLHAVLVGGGWDFTVHDLRGDSPWPIEEPMSITLSIGAPRAMAAEGDRIYVVGDAGAPQVVVLQVE